ncbi:MAG: KR domain-containing protein [Candidatus Competibacteraceae bacterium]
MAPKVDGCWNLHTHTLDQPLDHFVLFSSVSALVGNPGQANYVAANSFLDTFAQYRHALGIPALTVNWGRLDQVRLRRPQSGSR